MEVDCDDCEHDEPTAPKTCCPSNIFFVMTMGVLSEHCELCLDHVLDKDGSNGRNKVSVPSRAEIKADAILDHMSIISGDTQTKSADGSLKMAMLRVKDRAGYNEVYKAANKAKIDLGAKRLKLEEEVLTLKQQEVDIR